MKHKIELRLVTSLGAAALIIIVIFGFSYRAMQQLHGNGVAVAHSYEVIGAVEASYATLKDAESGQRCYLLTHGDEFLNIVRAAPAKFDNQIQHLEYLTLDNPTQQARLRVLGAAGHDSLNFLENNIQLFHERGLEAAMQNVASGSGMQEMAEAYSVIKAIRQDEESLLAKRLAASQASASTAPLALAALGAVVLIALTIAYLFVGREMAGRRRTEGALRTLNEELETRVQGRTAELEASNKELEAFSYSVSHDLRAPLRHIRSFAKLLEENVANVLDETGSHYLQRIQEASERMGRLVDDLLNFSRLGRTEISQERVDLKQLFEEVLQELQPDTAGRQILWQIADLPVVKGNREMLRTALINLVSNAVKFTRPRATAHIEAGCREVNGGEAVCYLSDNGVGFDMQYADNLFGVFQRLHRSKDFEGTGIGLANVRRIIHRHGGRLQAEAAVGRGATFYFSLPVWDGKGIPGR